MGFFDCVVEKDGDECYYKIYEIQRGETIMKSRLLAIMGCSILLLAACGNTVATEQDTTGAVLSTEYVQETECETVPETEIETEMETDTEVEETIESTESEAILYTYSDLDKTMYAKQSVNVRDLPSTEGEKLGGLTFAQEVKVTGQCNETSWYRIEFENGVAYVSNSYLVEEKESLPTETTTTNTAKDPFAWHDGCRGGLWYTVEGDEHYCHSVYGVHYEVTEETKTILCETRFQKEIEWENSPYGYYYDSNTVSLNSTGIFNVEMPIDQFIVFGYDKDYIIYSNLDEYYAAEEAYISNAEYEVLMSRGYIQILPTPEGSSY